MEADARQSRKYSNRGTFFAIVLCVTLGFVVSGVTAVQARQQAGPNGPWALVLVRADQPLPRDFTVDLLQVDGVQVDKRIAQPLLRMLEDARQDGVTLELCGAYRSVKEQRALADALTEQLVQQGDSLEQGLSLIHI